MISVARGHADISRVCVDVQRVADEPFIADHVATVWMDLDVTLEYKYNRINQNGTNANESK